MPTMTLIRECSTCGRATGDDSAQPRCLRCRKGLDMPQRPKCRHCDKNLAAKGKRRLCWTCAQKPELRALYPSESPQGPQVARVEYETGQLPCRRCGKLVNVAMSLVNAHKLGMEVTVECEKACLRTLPNTEVESDS